MLINTIGDIKEEALAGIPDGAVQFGYKTVYSYTTDPRRNALSEGDTLVVEPGLIRVMKNGREVAFFALDVFLWWHKRIFHVDFWRECVRELEALYEESSVPLNIEGILPRKQALSNGQHHLVCLKNM